MQGIRKRLLILVVIFGLILLYVNIAPLTEKVPLRNDLNDFPILIGDWTGLNISPDDNIPFQTLENYIYRSYRNDAGITVFCYIGYLAKFKHGSNIFSGRYLTPGYGWVQIKEKEMVKEIKNKFLRIKKVVFKKGTICKRIFYWYYTNRGAIVGRDEGRIYNALDTLLNRKTNISLIKISSEPLPSNNCDSGASSGEELFIDQILPYLERFLPFDYKNDISRYH